MPTYGTKLRAVVLSVVCPPDGRLMGGWMTVRPRGLITSLTLTTRLQVLQLQPATCNQALFAVPHCKGVVLAHDRLRPPCFGSADLHAARRDSFCGGDTISTVLAWYAQPVLLCPARGGK